MNNLLIINIYTLYTEGKLLIKSVLVKIIYSNVINFILV